MWIPFKRSYATAWGYLLRGIKLSILTVIIAIFFCAYQVFDKASYQLDPDYQADVAVVLGAAAWGNKPSPVFRERINYAIQLYKEGRVKKIAFTGGTPKKGYMTEAEVGKRYAMLYGIPARDIVLENTSRNTYQNLLNIRPILNHHNLQRIIIISDPYHLARTAVLCQSIRLEAELVATPTTRYREPKTKFKQFWLETWRLFGLQINLFFNRTMTFLGMGS